MGAVYASTAALLKALTSMALEGIGPLLSSWQLYVVVVLGATGLLLNQLAFQAGPLNASLPATSTVDPLLLVLGVAVIALTRTEHTPDRDDTDPSDHATG